MWLKPQGVTAVRPVPSRPLRAADDVQRVVSARAPTTYRSSLLASRVHPDSTRSTLEHRLACPVRRDNTPMSQVALTAVFVQKEVFLLQAVRPVSLVQPAPLSLCQSRTNAWTVILESMATSLHCRSVWTVQSASTQNAKVLSPVRRALLVDLNLFHNRTIAWTVFPVGSATQRGAMIAYLVPQGSILSAPVWLPALHVLPESLQSTMNQSSANYARPASSQISHSKVLAYLADRGTMPAQTAQSTVYRARADIMLSAHLPSVAVPARPGRFQTSQVP